MGAYGRILQAVVADDLGEDGHLVAQRAHVPAHLVHDDADLERLLLEQVAQHLAAGTHHVQVVVERVQVQAGLFNSV